MNSHPSTGNLKENIQEIRRFKREAIQVNSSLQTDILQMQRAKATNLKEIEEMQNSIADLSAENRNLDASMVKALDRIRENDEKIRKFDQQLEDLTDGLLD